MIVFLIVLLFILLGVIAAGILYGNYKMKQKNTTIERLKANEVETQIKCQQVSEETHQRHRLEFDQQAQEFQTEVDELKASMEKTKFYQHIDPKDQQQQQQSVSILWSQQIFIPHKASIALNIEAFRSIVDYFQRFPSEPHQICISAGGWVLNEELKELFLKDFQELKEKLDKIPQVSFVDSDNPIQWFDANYGYAFVTNQLVEPHLDSYPYIICNQSDIAINGLGCERLLERAITIADQLPEFGLLAFNIEHDFHRIDDGWKNIVINSRKKDDVCYVELVQQPPGDGGIAGSCTLFRTEAFKKACGYRQTGIYMPDDAYMLIDVLNAGYKIGVMRSLFMNHGRCESGFSGQVKQKYMSWKAKHLKESSIRGDNKACRRLDEKVLKELSKEVTEIFQEAFDESVSSSSLTVK